MKRFIFLALIMMSSVILTSCANETPQPANKLINPGDRIGDFLITTGNSEDVVYVTKLHCPYDTSTSTETCEQPINTKVNVGIGIYGDKGKSVDEVWSEQIHEMTIEGHPVNLQAFGTVDFEHSMVGIVRVWNVVVVTDKPGTITAHSTGTVSGEPLDYTAIITFSKP